MTPRHYLALALLTVGPVLAARATVGQGPPIRPDPGYKDCVLRLDAIRADRLRTLQAHIWDLDQQIRELHRPLTQDSRTQDSGLTLASLETQRQDLRDRRDQAYRDRLDYRPCGAGAAPAREVTP